MGSQYMLGLPLNIPSKNYEKIKSITDILQYNIAEYKDGKTYYTINPQCFREQIVSILESFIALVKDFKANMNSEEYPIDATIEEPTIIINYFKRQEWRDDLYNQLEKQRQDLPMGTEFCQGHLILLIANSKCIEFPQVYSGFVELKRQFIQKYASAYPLVQYLNVFEY